MVYLLFKILNMCSKQLSVFCTKLNEFSNQNEYMSRKNSSSASNSSASEMRKMRRSHQHEGWCFSWFFIEISNVECSRVKKLGFRSFPIQPKHSFIAITGWCSLVWMLSEMMEKSLVNYIVDFPCKVWHWSGVSNIAEK